MVSPDEVMEASERDDLTAVFRARGFAGVLAASWAWMDGDPLGEGSAGVAAEGESAVTGAGVSVAGAVAAGAGVAEAGAGAAATGAAATGAGATATGAGATASGAAATAEGAAATGEGAAAATGAAATAVADGALQRKLSFISMNSM